MRPSNDEDSTKEVVHKSLNHLMEKHLCFVFFFNGTHKNYNKIFDFMVFRIFLPSK